MESRHIWELLLKRGDNCACSITLLSSTCLSWRMWTPVHHHKPTGTKIQEALSCPNRAEYLIFWQRVGQTEGQLSVFWSVKKLERIWISGNLKLCYYSCGHIHCKENCMNWRQKGKRNVKLCGSDLSVGNQALETSWAGPFRENCAIWDSPLYRFSAHKAYRRSNLLSVEVIDRIPLGFQSSDGAMSPLWIYWLYRHLNRNPRKVWGLDISSEFPSFPLPNTVVEMSSQVYRLLLYV